MCQRRPFFAVWTHIRHGGRLRTPVSVLCAEFSTLSSQHAAKGKTRVCVLEWRTHVGDVRRMGAWHVHACFFFTSCEGVLLFSVVLAAAPRILGLSWRSPAFYERSFKLKITDESRIHTFGSRHAQREGSSRRQMPRSYWRGRG